MIRELFKKGQQIMLDEAAKAEAGKTGNLRGGSSGMLTPGGETTGQCRALTYLRYHGVVVEPVDASRDLMFDAGRRNEDHWYDVLSKSLPEGMIIMREEEIPTKWTNKDGIDVTGRPDIVICDKNKKPVTGIELKLVSSLWTARDVMFQSKPKLNHLIQAAHYSWQLGCPFELWYTARADFAITGDWPKNLFPKAGEPGSEFCQYAFYEEGEINSKTKKPIKRKITEDEYKLKLARGQTVYCDILKILPFVKGYELDIHEGTLYVKDAMVDNAPWVETIVKIDDIKRYYDNIVNIKKVPSEPRVKNFDGTVGNYKASQYCSLGDLCCGKCEGMQIDSWVDKVKAKVTE